MHLILETYLLAFMDLQGVLMALVDYLEVENGLLLLAR